MYNESYKATLFKNFNYLFYFYGFFQLTIVKVFSLALIAFHSIPKKAINVSMLSEKENNMVVSI